MVVGRKMKAQGRFLQSRSSQIAEFTSYTAAIPGTRLKFKQAGKVPKHGPTREKSSQKIYEVMIVSVFLIFLLLTGCSGSMTGTQRYSGVSPIFEVAGTPTVPHSSAAPSEASNEASTGGDVKVEPPAEAKVDAPKTDEAATKKEVGPFVQQEATAERVKRVIGWLQFVRQGKTAAILQDGWDHLQARKVSRKITTEIGLWREVLAAEIKANTAKKNKAVVERLEVLALALASAQSPDDLLRADDFFYTDAQLAGYTN